MPSMPRLAAAALALALAAGPTTVTALVPQNVSSADQWRDDPTLAPGVFDPQIRARMNAEIVQAIRDSNGDEAEARRRVQAIAARYEQEYGPQGARTRPGPK